MTANLLSQPKLRELKLFVNHLDANPQLIHEPELSFLKEFIEKWGGTIPVKVTPIKEEPIPEKMEVEVEEEEEKDSEILPQDNDPPLETGDENVEVSEEMRDESTRLKSQAMDLQREGNLPKSLEMFTAALKKNPRLAVLYANRAQVLLEMKKPNAAIRDSQTAIKINPDSSKPYKIRGKALRYLGQYEAALKDIQIGQKLDWDESTHSFEVELKKKVDKIQDKRKKHEEKRKAREKAQAKAQENKVPSGGSQQTEEEEEEDMPDLEGMQLPPGFSPEMAQNILKDPEVMVALQDPATLSKLQEILRDPTKISQYQNDPKLKLCWINS